MWPFSAKAKLIRRLDHLAFYNDKGVAYARHNEQMAKQERANRMREIDDLVQRIGPANLPALFLDGLSSGAVETDGTGRFVDIVKQGR